MGLLDRLNSDGAAGWRPEPGDTLIGEIIDLSERTGDYEPYPIVTVQPEGGGDPVAVHAFHSVIKREVSKLKPNIGDKVGFKYLGEGTSKDGKTKYQSYRVVLERSAIDWSARQAEAEEIAALEGAATSTVTSAFPGAEEQEMF